MSALAITEDRLQVRQLRLEYTACGNQQAAWSAQHRLDRLLKHTLLHQLNGLFDPLRTAGDGLWFIQCLDLSTDIDLDLSDQDIQRSWSYQFAQALQKKLLDQCADDVVYFPDYHSYLGQFIAAVAKGIAHSAWYFDPFASVSALPAHMAIVTVLLRQPDIGLKALLSLSRSDLARVLNALTAKGAEQLLEGFSKHKSPQPVTDNVLLQALIVELDQQHNIPILVSEYHWLATLELYLRVIAQCPGSSNSQLIELASAVVTLKACELTGSDRFFQAVITALQSNDQVSLFKSMPISEAQQLQPLIQLNKVEKQQLIKATSTKHSSKNNRDNVEPRYSFFGGVFLLLKTLQRIPLIECLQSWPEPPLDNKFAIVRLLLLSHCMGSHHAGQVFRDPVIRDLCGVGPDLTEVELIGWLHSIQAKPIQLAQQYYADWRMKESFSNHIKLIDEPFAKRRLAIAIEQERCCWLMLRGCQLRRIDRVQQALKKALPDASVEYVKGYAKSASVRADLSYLQLPSYLQSRHNSDWLLMIMAQGMLRDFAWRMPGFSGSSLSYIRGNFLSMDAKLEAEPERWLVRLGRAPLNMMLSMTGVNRSDYQMDWLDNQQIELYQEA